MNLNLPTEHVTAVCERLRLYREQNGYTATEFAEMLGIKRDTLASYEHNMVPPGHIVIKLSKISGNSADWWLCLEDKTNEEVRRAMRVYREIARHRNLWKKILEETEE